jgi:hypothetical protein
MRTQIKKQKIKKLIEMIQKESGKKVYLREDMDDDDFDIDDLVDRVMRFFDENFWSDDTSKYIRACKELSDAFKGRIAEIEDIL